MSIPPPVQAQINGLFSENDHTFNGDINDRVYVQNLFLAHAKPDTDSDVGSLIKAAQELQYVRLLLQNSVALGKKKAPPQAE